MERFWSKVKKTENCWWWLPTGDFHFEKRTQRPHRVAWILTYGPIPEGKNVCHSCDHGVGCPEGYCVRPDHLWLGTQAENMQDAKYKGRIKAGPGLPKGFGKGRRLSKEQKKAISEGVKKWLQENPEQVERLISQSQERGRDEYGRYS